MRLPKMTELAHDLLGRYIKEGDIVIDATAGNGHDTLFLAKRVGEQGKVYAFDIQEEALQHTKERIESFGCNNVHLIHDSHERLYDYVKDPIQAVIFNLGYLPGGNKKITTNAQSSIVAIQRSLALLKGGGIAVVVVYLGHTEGKAESEIIDQWITSLDEQRYHVLKVQYVNRTIDPPYILAIHKQV